MDWLHVCYAIIDCRTWVFKFQLQNDSMLEWKWGKSIPRGHFVSYLKTGNMTIKGRMYHIVRVMYVESKVPSLELAPIVKKFPEVFHNYLPGIPPE